MGGNISSFFQKNISSFSRIWINWKTWSNQNHLLLVKTNILFWTNNALPLKRCKTTEPASPSDHSTMENSKIIKVSLKYLNYQNNSKPTKSLKYPFKNLQDKKNTTKTLKITKICPKYQNDQNIFKVLKTHWYLQNYMDTLKNSKLIVILQRTSKMMKLHGRIE